MASVGLDQTTTHRLRIPSEILAQNSAIAAGSLSIFEKIERQFLEPFFSVREYGLFSTLVIVPLHVSSKLFAFFLVAYSKEDGPIENEDALFENVAQLGAANLYGKYYEWLSKLPSYPDDAFSVEYLAKIDSLIDQSRQTGKQLLIVELNMEVLLESVLSTLTYADKKRILDDMETVLFSFSAGLGLYFRKTDRNVLLGFPVRSAQDHFFLSDHIVRVLNNRYPNCRIPSGVILSTKTMGEIHLSSRDLLNSL
ncbi:MAG: hypothetical protein CMN78_01700 [Spirochaetales bacterium]|nr:hypothetical protein [Spirochaetales bacterium]